MINRPSTINMMLGMKRMLKTFRIYREEWSSDDINVPEQKLTNLDVIIDVSSAEKAALIFSKLIEAVSTELFTIYKRSDEGGTIKVYYHFHNLTGIDYDKKI